MSLPKKSFDDCSPDTPVPGTDDLLGIGITCKGGATFEDPSVNLLAHLLTRLPSEASWLILERHEEADRGPFIQTAAATGDPWVVEYRDSQAEPLFHAETDDASLVRTVLTEWCLGRPAWRDRLVWAPHEFTPRPTTVVLRAEQGPGGSRSLTARRSDGGVVIEGQDIGPGVEAAFGSGNREYEWTWAISPEALPAAVLALGGGDGDDALPLLKAWSASNDGRDPGSFLKDAGVPVEFWNRIGD